MKTFIILLGMLMAVSEIASSQYDNPDLDQIPAEFWDASNPQTVNAVITDASGFDNFNIGTDFGEPHLSMNPANPLNCFVAYNTNGAHYVLNGHDWSATFSPSFGVTAYGDPVTAFDSLGNLFYENMVGGITGTRVIRSTNGGVSFLTAVAANTGNDKNWMAADQTGGPYANYIYTVMTPGNFKRSINNGSSFTLTYSTTNNYPGMMVCIGPNGSIQGGAVYIVSNTGSSAFAVTYNFFRSLDGGATFTVMSSQSFAGVVGDTLAGRHSVKGMRTRPYPMITADNSYGAYRGRFYVIYAKNNVAGFTGKKPNIYCRYSTNQGSTFSSEILVNADTSGYQFFPAIWCDKTTGRLYCKWFDTRDDPTNNTMHVYASYSDNGGVTWAANQRITTAPATINCTTCGGGGTPRYQGDYDAISSNSKTAMMAWTDMRAGTFGSYTAYFPDFAMLVSPSSSTIHQSNDSKSIDVNIPAVKLYNDNVSFTTTVSPVPATGSVIADFPGGNTLTPSYPNALSMRVRTVGTVTPTGNYTVTVTGSGPNGTPVHKRNVTMTVNSTLGPVPCTDFSGTIFPPDNFYEEFTGTNYWSRVSASAYGTGLYSAKFDFFNADISGGPVNQSIISNNFPAAGANTYLTFDNAYAPYGPGFGPDTLVVETSADFGGNYTVLKTILGNADGSGELNTAPAQISAYSPSASQWRPKIFLLPAGTNKIRLKAKSGNGNNLYIDNVCVQTLSAPLTNTIGVVPEGMWLNSYPFISRYDTVKVYLHRTDFPNIKIDSSYGLITENALINNLNFSRALTGTYYKVVHHRNCITTWSKDGGEVYTRGSNVHFSFLNPSGQAYGNNQKLVNPFPYYAMISGDVDQDEIIDATDLSAVENSASVSLTGYYPEDVTGDDYTDASDVSIVENNLGEVVSAPPGAEPQPELKYSEDIPEFRNDNERIKYESGKLHIQEIKVRDINLNKERIRRIEILKKKYNTEKRRKALKESMENSFIKTDAGRIAGEL